MKALKRRLMSSSNYGAEWLFVLVVLTVVLGTIGYCLEDPNPASVYPSLLNSLFLLVLNGPIEPTNLLIEIARWCGVAFAVSVIGSIISSAFKSMLEDMVTRHRAKAPGAVAVHGDGVYADTLAKGMGTLAVQSDRPASFLARTQILLFSDDDKALTFFDSHYDELMSEGAKDEGTLGDREIYIALDGISLAPATRGSIFAFSLANTTAQLYWENHPVNENETIAIIGSGSYAEEILAQGLLTNVYDIHGGTVYRCYGDFNEYRSLHPQLDAALGVNEDVLVFSGCPWYEDIDFLKHVDRIILCEEAETNLETASRLRAAGTNVSLHIRSDSDACSRLLDAGGDSGLFDATSVFGTCDQLCTKAIVIQQVHHDSGKIVDIEYRRKYSDMCELCANRNDNSFSACLACDKFRKSWSEMSEFMRDSNYAVAAHDSHKERLMRALATDQTDEMPLFNDLDQTNQDQLQNIEHIRWCRFHYLNNWEYASQRDNAARKHNLLVPYDRLSEIDKKKDADAYLTLPARRRGTKKVAAD